MTQQFLTASFLKKVRICLFNIGGADDFENVKEKFSLVTEDELVTNYN